MLLRHLRSNTLLFGDLGVLRDGWPSATAHRVVQSFTAFGHDLRPACVIWLPTLSIHRPVLSSEVDTFSSLTVHHSIVHSLIGNTFFWQTLAANYIIRRSFSPRRNPCLPLHQKVKKGCRGKGIVHLDSLQFESNRSGDQLTYEDHVEYSSCSLFPSPGAAHGAALSGPDKYHGKDWPTPDSRNLKDRASRYPNAVTFANFITPYMILPRYWKIC